MSELERITVRRSELDALAGELGKQLQEVQAEREELVIAERVLQRLAEQDRAEAEAAVAEAPVKVQVAGHAALPCLLGPVDDPAAVVRVGAVEPRPGPIAPGWPAPAPAATPGRGGHGGRATSSYLRRPKIRFAA
ncbi:hypothetical protein P3T27_003421 [Kitasatospora sp. MAA19]|uniref:hypothetical protein n=1 Tax=Kitasatospora sp. MAA19 TaxID=3035090 RepID=UPI0024748676|nr:hypothetical protein [Kitasatospora sp. MAA19]MDH6706694.1 hypothetical protein [Kitasatospora sp. MAA19]